MPIGEQTDYSSEWLQRLDKSIATGLELYPAAQLYCGRSFTEAALAAKQANHYIVSAGLGLLESQTKIPAYALTVTGNTPDNLRQQVKKFDLEAWWRTLESSPFSTRTIAKVCADSKLVILALPSNYLDLITSRLLEIKALDRQKIRIVGVPKASMHPALADLAMPIDARLDGPMSSLPGTKTDFAVRSARFMVENTISALPTGNAEEHSGHLEKILKKWLYPAPIKRQRLSDEEIKLAVKTHWQAVDGKSGLMLRHLRRNLELACEQSRFRTLFNEVKLELEGN